MELKAMETEGLAEGRKGAGSGRSKAKVLQPGD